MLHPDLRLQWIDESIGYGIFANQWVPRGTLLWVLDELDQVLSRAAVRTLGPRYGEILERYGYQDATGRTVLCWDLGRYMNHSCEPNCVGPGHGLFDLAIRDIPPGTEVTTDYACLNIERAMPCRCGAPGCRGQIRERDIEGISVALDEELRRALHQAAHVRQPLFEWVDQALLRQSTEKPDQSPSVLALRAAGGSSR